MDDSGMSEAQRWGNPHRFAGSNLWGALPLPRFFMTSAAKK